VWCPPKCRIPLGRCFCLSHFSGPCFSERTRGESLALPLPSPICSAFRTDAGELHTHTPHHARRSRPREEREGESESGCTAQICCAAFVPSFWCKLVRLLGQQESAGRDFQTRHGRSLQAVLKNREECDRGRSLEARLSWLPARTSGDRFAGDKPHTPSVAVSTQLPLRETER